MERKCSLISIKSDVIFHPEYDDTAPRSNLTKLTHEVNNPIRNSTSRSENVNSRPKISRNATHHEIS